MTLSLIILTIGRPLLYYYYYYWFSFQSFFFYTSISCIIIFYYPWEFFTAELADGLSLEFEWQQVPSSLKDSSQYSGWSKQCCCLDCLSLSPLFPSPFTNPLVTVPRAPIIIGITVTFMFHGFFNSLVKFRYLSFFSLSFNFTIPLIKLIIFRGNMSLIYGNSKQQ